MEYPVKTPIRLLAVAAIAAWIWALAPMGVAQLTNWPTGFKDSDRLSDWHVRLVPPAWVGSYQQYYYWARAESLARLALVSLGILATLGCVAWRAPRGPGTTPTAPWRVNLRDYRARVLAVQVALAAHVLVHALLVYPLMWEGHGFHGGGMGIVVLSTIVYFPASLVPWLGGLCGLRSEWFGINALFVAGEHP